MSTESLIRDKKKSLQYGYGFKSIPSSWACIDIHNRFKREQIKIQKFQRAFAWNDEKQCRFIESLILDFPIPTIFLTYDNEEDKNYSVIDGQQRLETIRRFFNNEFKLKGVLEELDGRCYEDLRPDLKRDLEDKTLYVVIIEQTKPDGSDSMYHIFERLNSGGVQLSPQEIRNGIYNDLFTDLLNELIANEDWKYIIGKKGLKKMREQELILRFFALYYYLDNYENQMSIGEFLNEFIKKNKELGIISKDELIHLFTKTIKFVRQTLEKNAFKKKKKINFGLYDFVMTGAAHIVQKNKEEELASSFASIVDRVKQEDIRWNEYIPNTSYGKEAREKVKSYERLFLSGDE